MIKKYRKLIVVFSFTCLFGFSSCYAPFAIGLKGKKEEARQQGREEGLKNGRTDAEKNANRELANDKAAYEKTLSVNAEKNAKEVKRIYDFSFESGSASMKNDLNSIIDTDVTKKRQKRDAWNSKVSQ